MFVCSMKKLIEFCKFTGPCPLASVGASCDVLGLSWQEQSDPTGVPRYKLMHTCLYTHVFHEVHHFSYFLTLLLARDSCTHECTGTKRATATLTELEQDDDTDEPDGKKESPVLCCPHFVPSRLIACADALM